MKKNNSTILAGGTKECRFAPGTPIAFIAHGAEHKGVAGTFKNGLSYAVYADGPTRGVTILSDKNNARELKEEGVEQAFRSAIYYCSQRMSCLNAFINDPEASEASRQTAREIASEIRSLLHSILERTYNLNQNS